MAIASRRRTRREPNDFAFLNIPYDDEFEDLYLAYIAGLCGLGLKPRATVEIPGSQRRLDKIYRLIRECRYSFHDLSRVEIDATPPPTPRFNMSFELGLAVAHAKNVGNTHQWFVFETEPHRIKKSLSDLDGTDTYIHKGDPRCVLIELANALARKSKAPSFGQLSDIHVNLRRTAERIKLVYGGRSLFGARPFKDLVIAATGLAKPGDR